MLGTCLDQVRTFVPLVHNITNYVTVNDVANILLACGGSPIMSDEPEDVADITSICGGSEPEYRYLTSEKHRGHVPAQDTDVEGASASRSCSTRSVQALPPFGPNTALRIMDELQPTVIRGNISEIKTLAFGSGTTKGVDADVGRRSNGRDA